MLANYHTHTKRCQHATGEDREYVEAAIEAGLKILGFADHCPWIYPDKDFVSGIRMAPNQVDDYFYSLESLKKEYVKDIKIYIGLETEHCPDMIPDQDKLLEGYPLDYMLCGQHFLGAETPDFYAGRARNDEAFLKKYVDIAIDGINSGRYLYLAHPDLINFTGEDEIYRKHMKRLCEALKVKNIPVEINVLGLWTNRHYPSKRFFELAKETGNTAIIGTDAHAPKHLVNKEAVRKAELFCEEFDLPIIDDDLLKDDK